MNTERKSRQGKRFYELFSQKDAAEQDDFLETVKVMMRRLVGSDKAHDLANDTMLALLESPTLYPYISLGLVYCKARELAPAYRGWPTHDEISDALTDPGDNPLEGILNHEAEKEAEQDRQSRLAQVREAVAPEQWDFLNSVRKSDENRRSDDEQDPYRHGPERLQFDYDKISEHVDGTAKDVEKKVEAIRKRLELRGMMPTRTKCQQRRGSTSTTTP